MGLQLNTEMQAQYEAFPYPERDPEDEAKRLITGSPSLPQEMDHYLWGGARDWSKPLKALVAGGGTGDGLIQLAQVLTSAGRPYEITYVDLSVAARRTAEARVAKRGLKGIQFETGSLLDARELGEFDYIDCCGVLHHLPDPQAGFTALSNALAPGGGIGLMVYAPHGRSGVYPLQSAFGRIGKGLPPEDKLRTAKAIFSRLPEGHPFKCNPHLVDHEQSDAGFFDLLLHSSDMPFSITDVFDVLSAAGLEAAGFPEPALYDPSDLLPKNVLPEGLSDVETAQLAEDLRGTFKTHTIYAVRKGKRLFPPLGQPSAVPILRGVDAGKLSRAVASSGEIRMKSGGVTHRHQIPKTAAPVIARIDGKTSLNDVRTSLGLDPIAFNMVWKPVENTLTGSGLLHYSKIVVP